MIWRQVPGFPSYELSEFGEIRHIDSGAVRRPSFGSGGYRKASFRRDGKVKTVQIHRMVALAFLGEPPTRLHQVAHLDGDIQNNHYSNLKWKTPKENSADKHLHGTHREGVQMFRHTLNDAQVIEIREKYSTGNYLQRELAELFGVGPNQIGRVVRRIDWRHVSGCA